MKVLNRLMLLALIISGCTQEVQNKISRSIQNWTGTDGVLDVVSNGKVMYRFIQIDKLTTGTATSGSGGMLEHTGMAMEYSTKIKTIVQMKERKRSTLRSAITVQIIFFMKIPFRKFF